MREDKLGDEAWHAFGSRPPASPNIIGWVPARAPESRTPGLGLGSRSHPEFLVPRISNASPFEARPLPFFKAINNGASRYLYKRITFWSKARCEIHPKASGSEARPTRTGRAQGSLAPSVRGLCRLANRGPATTLIEKQPFTSTLVAHVCLQAAPGGAPVRGRHWAGGKSFDRLPRARMEAGTALPAVGAYAMPSAYMRARQD